jgi:hypothetical protein
MSKYAILIIINVPLIAVGIISAITDYKASRIITKRKCMLLILFWLLIGFGLILVEPVYDALIRAHLTDSPPLSLFDIALLTALVFLFFFIMKMNERLDVLNQKLSRIHERLAMISTENDRS